MVLLNQSLVQFLTSLHPPLTHSLACTRRRHARWWHSTSPLLLAYFESWDTPHRLTGGGHIGISQVLHGHRLGASPCYWKAVSMWMCRCLYGSCCSRIVCWSIRKCGQVGHVRPLFVEIWRRTLWTTEEYENDSSGKEGMDCTTDIWFRRWANCNATESRGEDPVANYGFLVLDAFLRQAATSYL